MPGEAARHFCDTLSAQPSRFYPQLRWLMCDLILSCTSACRMRDHSHSIIKKPRKTSSGAGFPVFRSIDTMKNTMFNNLLLITLDVSQSRCGSSPLLYTRFTIPLQFVGWRRRKQWCATKYIDRSVSVHLPSVRITLRTPQVLDDPSSPASGRYSRRSLRQTRTILTRWGSRRYTMRNGGWMSSRRKG